MGEQGKVPPKKREREQRTTKESSSREQTEEHEIKLEQIVNAVKEGFQSQNNLLANTIKGTNQARQEISHTAFVCTNFQASGGSQLLQLYTERRGTGDTVLLVPLL